MKKKMSYVETQLEAEEKRLKNLTPNFIEVFDNENYYVFQMLKLDAEKEHFAGDLEDPEILERALVLLTQQWVGAERPHHRLTPQIRYNGLIFQHKLT